MPNIYKHSVRGNDKLVGTLKNDASIVMTDKACYTYVLIMNSLSISRCYRLHVSSVIGLQR